MGIGQLLDHISVQRMANLAICAHLAINNPGSEVFLINIAKIIHDVAEISAISREVIWLQASKNPHQNQHGFYCSNLCTLHRSAQVLLWIDRI